MRRWLVALALVLLACLATPAAAQDGNPCDPDVLVGETETEYICMRLDHVEPRKAVCSALLRVNADKQAILALDPRFTNEMFDHLAKLSQEQKAEFEKKALIAGIEAGLQVTVVAVDKVSTLNAVNVNTVIKRLEGLGADDPIALDAIRRVAMTRGKPEMAKSYADFTVRIKAAKDGAEAQAATDNKTLRWSLAALKLVQTNPYADLVVTGVEFAESAFWYGFINSDINYFNKDAEDRLTKLASLNERMKGHVGELRTAREAWKKLAGDDDPRCDAS